MILRFPCRTAALAAMAGLLPFGAAQAQAAGADEVAALRAEIAALRQQYETRVRELELRLDELAAPQPVAGATDAVGPPPARSIADAPAPSPAVTRGGSLNPAMSAILAGTYGHLEQGSDDYAIAGFFPAGDEIGPGEGGFSLGESEITLSAAVDPYFNAALTVALTGEGELEVEEAFARTSSLPGGFTVKAGRFFSGIGYLNEVHAHAWDFVDQPLAYQAFFGGQLGQDGVQVRWVAPTDTFVEFGVEAGNGDTFPGTRDEGNAFGTTALFAHVGGDAGTSVSWRAGVSWVDADAMERAYEDVDALGSDVVDAFSGESRTWMLDAVFKYAPGGDARRNAWQLQAEFMRREERGRLAYDLAGAALDGSFRNEQDAWYVEMVYGFAPRWRAGLRYDSLDSGEPRIGLVADGTLSADDFPLLRPAQPSRVTVMADWSPTEFSRLRAQYAWDDARDTGDADQQWLLQYIHAIGAHGAHRF